MRLPRKWVLSMALLATAPGYVVAGPADSTGAPAAAPSNQAMANKIASALKSAQLKGKGVQLQFDKGVCTISGEAADPQQKALASQVISSVPGVTSVNNNLTVAATARPMPGVTQAAYEGAPRQPVRQVSADAAAPATNQETAQAIAEALSASGLSKYDIEVRYSAGTCTLGGSVGTPEAAAQAEQAARSVAGVQNVVNRMTCQGRPVAQARPAAPVMPAGYPQTAYAPQAGMPQAPMGPMGADPRMGMPPGMGMAMSPQQIQQMGLRQPVPGGPVPMSPQAGPGVIPAGGHLVYNQPNVPDYAWPSYAAYDNTAAVTYPGQYDASAFPYIGPYYPYPQVPLGWRKSTLEWKDGSWNLKFSSRTDRWWWFMNPHNWTE
jgi:osmotically-inducible protein OsmY